MDGVRSEKLSAEEGTNLEEIFMAEGYDLDTIDAMRGDNLPWDALRLVGTTEGTGERTSQNLDSWEYDSRLKV